MLAESGVDGVNVAHCGDLKLVVCWDCCEG